VLGVSLTLRGKVLTVFMAGLSRGRWVLEHCSRASSVPGCPAALRPLHAPKLRECAAVAVVAISVRVQVLLIDRDLASAVAQALFEIA